MKSSEHKSQKKRKSDVNIDFTSTLPSKKDRPWYAEEASADNKITVEKERRKSIIGLGKGLLKKMRSSSALKDRNSRDSNVTSVSASTSKMPTFKEPSTKVGMDPMPEEQTIRSENSSILSGDSCVLPHSIQRNKELMKLVENVSTTSHDSQSSHEGLSFLAESCSSQDNGATSESAASFCTPARDFKRGDSHRGSARSMPPESDLIRGLCNSAIRRTLSSASDSLASPHRFDRTRSMRFREKLLLSSSMAELPEEEVAPLDTCDEGGEETRTPLQGAEGSSRRSSLVWLRSKSRIFGSKKRGDVTTTPLGTSTLGTPAAAEEGITPGGSGALRRSSLSSSSLQRKVSSVLRKGLGLRNSNHDLTVDLTGRTPCGILKRSSTNSKDRKRKSANFPRRCSDVSAVLQRQVRTDQSRKEADEARLFMEKVVISKEPVGRVLYRDEYDGVVVDVSPMGLPLSSTAAEVLEGEYGVEIHKRGRSNPYKNGILKTPEGEPDIIYVVSEESDNADKRVRIGVATGMREAFESNSLKKVLLYPFCTSDDEIVADFLIRQFLLTSYKALTWNPTAKTFDGSITLAGVTSKNCVQMQRLHEELLVTEVRPKIAAYEALMASFSRVTPTQETPTENEDET
ncbi:hypothetical protein V3C99_002220 [Haemonchus contortus]|uniref:Non-specific serine/threonine protein kinase n=1 Tax=Haemonchus contortus TaxID=6289 RepID=A0A7I5E8T2_HAECO